MSFYAMVLGVNKAAPVLLRSLGLDYEKDIPRFRDCYYVHKANGGPLIHILTRTGLEEWEADNEGLRKHPLYLSDSRDPYDDTFRVFVFSLPEALQPDLVVESMEKWEEVRSLGERWEAAIKEVAEAAKAKGRS